MLNKKIITVISLTVSSFGFAGTMGPICLPGNVTIPCVIKQWDIGIQALYLKPTYVLEPGSTLPLTPDPIGTKWSMGYNLSGSYHFSTGNDLSLDWTHYNATRHHEIGLFSQNTRFDQANLAFGQLFAVGGLTSTRLYSGLQYANLHLNRLNVVPVEILGLPEPLPFVQNQNRDFNGVGPMFGIDFAYNIGISGLSITANTATSMLYGSSRANYNVSTLGLVTSNPYNSRKMMIPGLEEKLGLNYQTQFAQGLLTIDGGYQALNYFSMVTNTQTPRMTSDFGLYGPYLGVRWLGLA